jgi:hypothetical protein
MARFKVTRVWTIKGQSHAELKGDDGFVSLHRPASDNLTEGQEFILQSVEAVEEVSLMERNTTGIIRLPRPVSRLAIADARKDLLSDEEPPLDK